MSKYKIIIEDIKTGQQNITRCEAFNEALSIFNYAKNLAKSRCLSVHISLYGTSDELIETTSIGAEVVTK